jgi:hypothetical protein
VPLQELFDSCIDPQRANVVDTGGRYKDAHVMTTSPEELARSLRDLQALHRDRNLTDDETNR